MLQKITVFKSANTELFHHMVPIKDSEEHKLVYIQWYLYDRYDFFMMFPENPYKNDEPRKS